MNLQQLDSLLIFGGSFDPPHLGHVDLPLKVMQQIHASAVAYIPCASQPFKENQTPAIHRLAMLELALENLPCVHILTDEMDRSGVSYTVDTLRQLKEKLNNVSLRLLIGADQVAQFDRWKDWQQVIEFAEPVVMLRPPHDHQLMLPAGFDQAAWEKRTVQVKPMTISSTQIRQHVQDGKPIDKWVSPKVAQYIQEHGLYASEG